MLSITIYYILTTLATLVLGENYQYKLLKYDDILQKMEEYVKKYPDLIKKYDPTYRVPLPPVKCGNDRK